MAWKSGLQVRVIKGENTGEVTLLDSKRMSVGRTQVAGSRAEAWVLLSDKAISRRHLELVWEERTDSYSILHISKTNQTWLDGEVLADKAPLQMGQQIRLGDSTLVVEPASEQHSDDDRPSATPRANWELTETLNSDSIQDALAAAEASEGCFSLSITEGPEAGRRIPITGEYLTVGRNNLTAEHLFRDPATEPFAQMIELTDFAVGANHFLMRWNEAQNGYSLRKNPAAPTLSLGRVIDGNVWMTQLTKNAALFRAGDTLALGETVVELLAPDPE